MIRLGAFLGRKRPKPPRKAGLARALASQEVAKATAHLALVGAILALLMNSGVLQPINSGLAAMRFALIQHQPSDRIAVVEIDVPSLRAAGEWPWDRQRYSQAIANLKAAGADLVGFDVDFSAKSSAKADAAFGASISAQGGSVILPTFVQTVERDGREETYETQPLAAVSQDALLASVNVPSDPDGRVRRYQNGQVIDDTPRQSIGAMLGGSPRQSGDFVLDYGIPVSRIQRLSFEDVYQNRFDPALVRGRNVLIGATALELGDEFSTPVGIIPGVYLHALAAESIIAGRTLWTPPTILTFLLALGLVSLLWPRPSLSLKALTLRHLAAAAGILVIPVVLQVFLPVSLNLAGPIVGQALCIAWAVRLELVRRARQIVEEKQARLLHIAMHDPETGLPNRRALLAQLEERLADGGQWAVVVVGIDRHETLRGGVGYARFNELVGYVAARLRQQTGAEICALSTGVLALAKSVEATEDLGAILGNLDQQNPGYVVRQHRMDAFIRAGVAVSGPHSGAPEQLLENAAVALDKARAEDRRTVVYQPSDSEDVSQNLALMSEMQAGLGNGELSMYYQPKACARTGDIIGAEALVRWNHPERGSIRPDKFIGVAEETGSIRMLTEWTLAVVMEDAVALRETGFEPMLSVNLSGGLLADARFCERLLKMVAGKTANLCLEITETAVIHSPEAAMHWIAQFREAGLKISIDDYGVGLSSVSYLKMIEADELKLDKSLIENILTSRRDRLIVKSTIDMAHSLEMEVVAEGVEDEAVQAAIRLLGGDLIQGYAVARPMSFENFVKLLEAEELKRQGRFGAVSDEELRSLIG